MSTVSRPVIEDARAREPTLQEEAVAFRDDDLMDFMNLGKSRTGIEGTIFVSTAMGAHGPRVKYFEKTGKGQPSLSVSIAASPAVVASSLPEHVVQRMGAMVIDWVRLNRTALLEFWNEGEIWSEEKVDRFKSELKKV